MITINIPNISKSDYPFKPAQDYRGKSTDEKPKTAANGSTFLEIDTGNVFCYDAETSQWIAW